MIRITVEMKTTDDMVLDFTDDEAREFIEFATDQAPEMNYDIEYLYYSKKPNDELSPLG